MKTFKVGTREVGGDNPCFIVAELSANHAHNRDIALKTIDVAAECGADAIKLQTYTADTLTLDSDAPPFVVKTKNEWAGRTLHNLFKEAYTPWEWHAELFAHAKDRGIACFSTPFDPTAVAYLEDLGAECHKVASFELNDLPLVETVARTGKPMIMSTGMASLADIEAALTVCREAGNHDLALLRCVSCYPAKPEAMDLRAFETLKQMGVVVGLSDHTRDNTICIASIALGAKIIEKHFITDRSIGGPDAFFSLEPDELKAMIKVVRETEAAMGKARFGPGPDEIGSTMFRRSLFVSAPVKKGETFTSKNVRSVRPSVGMHPRHLGSVLGRVATRDIDFATPLAWDMVGEPSKVNSITLRAATAEDSSPLEGGSRGLYMAEDGGKKIGSVRLDPAGNDSVEVSLTVSPDAVEKGYETALLRAVDVEAKRLGVVRMVAYVKPEDAAGRKALEAGGYHSFVECTRGQQKMLRAEHRVVPYRPSESPFWGERS